MVLQSFRQYQSFATSQYVKKYALRGGDSKQSATLPQSNGIIEITEMNSTPKSSTSGFIKLGQEITHVQNPVPLLDAKDTGDVIDPFLIIWEDDEPDNPTNWSWTKKWTLVAMVASIALLVGAGSAIDSSAIEAGAIQFDVSTEVMTLQVAIFLIGFGVAAPFLGSLSEIGGRNPVYAITLFFFIIFQIGSALATNIETRIILRFFAGFFGSTPLSNAGGSLADIANARQRTFIFPVFACAGFMGPTIGPVIGGYIVNEGQEWCEWIVAIMAAAFLCVIILFMPETYGPVLLKMKASHIRKVTGDARYKTALEKERETVPFCQHFKRVLALPFLYLIYEPIVLFFALYMTVVVSIAYSRPDNRYVTDTLSISQQYIILFGDLAAYHLIFAPFGFDITKQGLAFIPIGIGLLLTLTAIPFSYSRYLRVTKKVQEEKRLNGDKNWEQAEPPPEERLVLAMFGTFLVPIGLFYQAWTTSPTLSVWPCLSAGVIIGAGILTCFISSYSYCIDVYKAGSATALGSLTFVRYIISGGAVMFTAPMYESLGNQWALSLLAFLSLASCAIPWVFYFYGRRIREKSRYVPVED